MWWYHDASPKLVLNATRNFKFLNQARNFAAGSESPPQPLAAIATALRPATTMALRDTGRLSQMRHNVDKWGPTCPDRPDLMRRELAAGDLGAAREGAVAAGVVGVGGGVADSQVVGPDASAVAAAVRDQQPGGCLASRERVGGAVG